MNPTTMAGYLSATVKNPFDGVQPDIDYSNGLVDVLNIRHYTFNIHGGTSGILDEMARVGIEASRQTKVNLPSRIRMATLYAIAQSEEGGIVINTSNLSEDWVGYCTIYGDSAGGQKIHRAEWYFSKECKKLQAFFRNFLIFLYDTNHCG